VQRVYVWNYKRRASIGKIAGFEKIPEQIDYNLWTGPAPMLPLLRKSIHYDWHWQWATGNGEIGNNGVHFLDSIRWALGKDHLPRTVMSFGGRYAYVDDGQTPNAHAAVYDYDGVPVVYEARGLPRASGVETMDDFELESASGKRITLAPEAATINSGFAIVCDGGYCRENVVYDNDGKPLKTFDAARDRPQKHFINAIRSRKISDLNPDIRDGHISTNLCHVGNASMLCGEAVTFAKAKQQVAANREAARSLERMMAHLTANKVDVGQAPVVMGATLTVDSENERFVGEHSDVANLFNKNVQRRPFQIPEHV
jgi:predicted dehydrogenase